MRFIEGHISQAVQIIYDLVCSSRLFPLDLVLDTQNLSKCGVVSPSDSTAFIVISAWRYCKPFFFFPCYLCDLLKAVGAHEFWLQHWLWRVLTSAFPLLGCLVWGGGGAVRELTEGLCVSVLGALHKRQF